MGNDESPVQSPWAGWVRAQGSFGGHSADVQALGRFALAMRDELDRATAKHGEQWGLPDSTDNREARHTFATIARNACDRAAREGRVTHAHILEEEVAEALEAAADGDLDACQEELIQVAAMAFRWHEAINRRAR